MAADRSLYDLAAAVLAVVVDHYAANVEAAYALPERRYVADGEPAWDCSQATVRVLRTFPTSGDPLVEAAPNVQPLYVLRAADMEVEIIRCAPTEEPNGVPTAADIDLSAQAVLVDAETVAAAIVAAVADGTLPGCSSVAIGAWQGLGPLGGLVGGNVLVRLAVA